MTIQLIESRDLTQLVPVLRDAEEGDDRIIQTIEAPHSAAYLIQSEGKTVGAAVMHWHPDESEIIYIAMDTSQRGQGYGKTAIRALIDEARHRQVKAVCVGTSNANWPNIAFYQKCGFRMHSVRKDYFKYIEPPIYDDGIKMQDMIMLRYDLSEG